MEKTGLVLQGGGIRGVYTSGVLDFFIEKEVCYPYVIGVSSGACNGATYIAKQQGFAKRMHIKYIHDRRYMSLYNLVKNGSFFGMDFIFDELPKRIEHFNLERLDQSLTKFWIVTTCCRSGEAVYFEKSQCEDVFYIIRASCSLPFITKSVSYEGEEFLDGGISDPIPIKKSIDDGNEKNVIVMTSDLSYPKKRSLGSWWVKKIYSNHEKLSQLLCNRYKIYYDTIDYIKKLERENKVFIIKPSKSISMKPIRVNIKKLNALYVMGYQDAKNTYKEMMEYLEGTCHN